MKRLVLVSLATTGVFFSAPAWSHHMAEGIISDDIWVAVDAVLQTTPHGELDLDAILMGMTITDLAGYPALTSSVTMDTTDPAVISEIQGYIDTVVTTFNTFPSDSGNADHFETTPVINDDGTTTFFVFEPTGSGNSQLTAPPVESPPQNGRQ